MWSVMVRRFRYGSLPILLGLTILGVMPVSTASAANVTWVDADGFWHIPVNWSSNPMLPGAADDVFNNTAFTITHSQGNDSILSFTTSGPLNITEGSLRILGGGMTLNSTATIDNSATLGFSNDQTLGGGFGSMLVFGAGANNRLSIDGNTTLTIGTIVRGQNATIGPAVFAGGTGRLINNSTIQVDVAGGVFTLNPSSNAVDSITNTGFLRAENGGPLNLNSNVTNTGGQITVGDNLSRINQNAIRITGGTINNTAGGRFVGSNSGSNILDGVTFNGALDLATATGQERIVNGLTLNGLISINTNSVLSAQGTQTWNGMGTVELGSTGGNNRFAIEGGTTLTLGADILVHGQNGTIGGQVFVGGASTLINQGTIAADAGGLITVLPNTLTNDGTLRAANGGTLTVPNTLTNLSGTTLTGGTYEVLADGGTATMRLPNANIVTNAATILLAGANSNLLNNNGGADALANFATNAAAGRFTIRDGRNFTTAGAFNNLGIVTVGNVSTFNTSGAFTNSGELQMRGGTLNATSLANSGEVNGFGALGVNVTNSGLVRAAGGTLTANQGITGASGTIQIDPGATLVIGANSSADFLVHNGNTPGSLNLGANNITVARDYTNADFGVGNSFDPRANVTGTGQIIGLNTQQAITGDVSNGTAATVTLNFGNVRGGTSQTLNYQIANTGPAGNSADLRGAIQDTFTGGGVTDARLSGTGMTAANFAPIAGGNNSGDLAVTFNASSGGALTGQSVRVLNNFDNVQNQVINITAFASALAQGNATPNSSPPVNLGNFRVGVGPHPMQNFDVMNTTTGAGAERLGIVSATTTGNFSATNNLMAGLVDGGATANNAVTATVSGGVAGVNNGNLAIQYLTNGQNIDPTFTSQNANLQNIALTATGWNVATGNATPNAPQPLNLGNFRVGVGPHPSQNFDVTNTAPAAFSEQLGVGSAGVSGNFALTNNIGTNRVNGQDTFNNALSVAVSGGMAGVNNGTVNIQYVSDGTAPGNSGFAPIDSNSQNITVQATGWNLATGAAAPSPLNLGNFHVGGAAPGPQNLNVTNTALAMFSEQLGIQSVTPTGLFTATNNLNGGRVNGGDIANNAITVGMNPGGTAGLNSGTVSVQYLSDGTAPGNSGFAPINSNSQDVTVTATGFRLAEALLGTIDFGNVLVGSMTTRMLSVRNTALADGFSESLNATFGTLTNMGAGMLSTMGSISQLAPGMITT